MTKAELRKIYAEKRNALSTTEYALLNAQLLEQFKSIDLSGVKCIHIFLPIPSRKEPNTQLIIKWLQDEHPKIKIIFPKTDFVNCSMQSFANDEHLQLTQTDRNILEPVSGTIVDDLKIGMIILPLLAFDKHGYRVGYGKGFYDRFIENCRADVRLVGLSFFAPVEGITDINLHDKKMQKCITPGKIINF